MDASVNFSGAASRVTEKCSTAYSPPEMFVINEISAEPVIRGNSSHEDEGGQDRLIASPSYDMWSLGVLLYEMCTGESLFHHNDADNVGLTEMLDLYYWDDELKTSKMVCNVFDVIITIIL